MRIGVVADNHRLIDPALAPLLTGVDEIWHAGDLVTPEILAALRSLAPVIAVRGNNDVSKELRTLPENELLEREGWRILLRHIVGKPGRVDREARDVIARFEPHVAVMGHSHMPQAEQSDGPIFLNPGSCGPRRFSLPRTAAVMELDASTLRFVVTDLDSNEVVLDRSFMKASTQLDLLS